MAFAGAKIYIDPEHDPISGGVVVVNGGIISDVGSLSSVRIPHDAQVIDCSGCTITAGFWNSHVHLFEKKWENAGAIPSEELAGQLQETFSRYGFTSVFDTGSMWENTRGLRDRIESGEVRGPRIRSTGEALVAAHALPSDTVLRMMGLMKFPAPEISSAEQASDAARRLIAEGVDAIKVHLQPPPPPDPPMPASAIAAAVSEAHRAGKPVFVHPATGTDILTSVQAGADIIAHTTPMTGPWTDELLSAMRDHGVALTPTVTLWKYFLRHERLSIQDQMVNTAVGQLRSWANGGGTVLFGTDLGATDYDPTPEYLLMTEAGMSLRQILTSLTTAPAERFGESHRLGRIARGFLADIVVLDGDPAKDIKALAAVRHILRDGKFISSSAVSILRADFPGLY